MILKELLPVQKFVLSSTASVIVVSGDLGSAKTTSGAIYAFVNASKKREKCKGLFVAQTHSQVKQTLCYSFEQILKGFSFVEDIDYKENKKMCLYTFPQKSSYQYTHYLRDGDEPVQSIEFSDIHFEEPQRMTHKVFQGFSQRCRWMKQRKKLILYVNPQTKKHWIYQDLIKTKVAEHYHARAIDNPHLPKTYIEDLKFLLTPKTYARMMEGKWITLEGAVFSDSFNEDALVIPVQDIPKIKFFYGGLDVGAKTAYVLKGVGDDGISYCLDCLEMDFMTITEKAQKIIALNEKYTSHNSVKIWADHDTDVVNQYKFEGVFTTPAIKKDKQNNIAMKEILFNSGKSKYSEQAMPVVDCILNLQYKEDKEEIEKKDDHLFDADTYADAGAIHVHALSYANRTDLSKLKITIPSKAKRQVLY